MVVDVLEVEVLEVELVLVLIVDVTAALPSSPPQPRCQEGHSTGVRNTMMQTTAARQAPDARSSLPLCSMAPRSIDRKNPLRRKKSTMLTELFTAPGYQNGARAGTRAPGSCGLGLPRRRW